MKTKLLFTLILAFFLILTGCSNNDDIQGSDSLSKRASQSKSSVIEQTYPQAQQEVMETFGAIGAAITYGAGLGGDGEYMDELISYHAYGDKFTDISQGQIFDSAGNELNERTFFGNLVAEKGVEQFQPKDGSLKIAVYYGNVANVTFQADFIFNMKDGSTVVNNDLITLLFIKTNGKWKMVHEHHSTSADDSGLASKASGSKSSVTQQPFSQAQQKVLETFGAIGAAITYGAGHGGDGEYMDELISYHAYGDKFTDISQGQIFDSAGNERNERTFFGELVEIGGVEQFRPMDGSLKIAVYNGNVANVTFQADFIFNMKDGSTVVNNDLITLLFVKTEGQWKMVHEHHSPSN